MDALILVEDKLVGSDSSGNDLLGSDVAVEGDTAVVGAPIQGLGVGAAYVFVRVGPTWLEQQKLTSGVAADTRFGASVALSGDDLIVGAPLQEASQGAVYPFHSEGGAWIQGQALAAPDPADGAQFGFDIAISGETMVVGAPYAAPSTQGAAYVFTRSGGAWSLQATLTPGSAQPDDRLGWAVAIDGDTAIATAPGRAGQAGTAFVFVRSGGAWAEQAQFDARDTGAGSALGLSVSLSGDTAVLGATGPGNGPGASYVFARQGATWSQQSKLTASNGAPGDVFGDAVGISGDTIAVGAPLAQGFRGSAYLFTRSGATWTEQSSFHASDTEVNDIFGHGIAISGNTALVGARQDDNYRGSAYVYTFGASIGEPCEAGTACLSGHCTGGVCCATACDAACNACTTGVCAPRADATACDDGDACTVDDQCQSGACLGAENPCTPPDACYGEGLCDPGSGTCVYPWSTCAHPSSPQPPGEGALDAPAGITPCETDAECEGLPGRATCSAEGVCCNAACDGECFSCRVPGAEGACVPETYMDLRSDCGPRGYCLKTCIAGACEPAPTEAEAIEKLLCAPVECGGETVAVGFARCAVDPAGGIPYCALESRPSASCEPYVCDPIRGGCLQQCASVDDCAAPFVCDPDHHCVPSPGLEVGEDRACAFAPSARRGRAPAALAALALAALLAARRRRAGAWALAAALLLTAGRAAAQPAPPPPAPEQSPAAPGSPAPPSPPAPAPESPPDPKAEALAHFEQGRKLVQEGDWAAALAEFLASRKLYPTWSATSSAARCLQQLRRYDEALAMLETLLRDFSNLTPEVKAAAQAEIIALRGRIGTLEIRGAEAGATLAVDGRTRGEYPLLAPLRVAAGSHLLRVYKEGFEPFERVVDVAGGQIAAVDARLTRLTQAGTLRVTEQSGKQLDVVIDGFVVGRAPWEGRLAAGEHTVELRGEGGLGALPRRVSLRPDASSSTTLTAEQLDASMELTPTPADASISIDGIFVGRGPLNSRLRPGPHLFKVVADGYFPEERRLTLARGEITRVTVTLERDPSSPAWRRPGRFGLEIVGGPAFSPGIGGDLAEACTGDCSAPLAYGGQLVVNGTFETWRGLGFGASIGYLYLRQSITGRPATLHPVGLPADQGTVDDLLKLRGFRVGAWASYRLGPERLPVRARLGAGALIGSVSDTRTGTFRRGGAPGACATTTASAVQPADPECFPIGEAISAPSASWFYLDPEVRVGYRLGDHLELSAGVSALVLMGLGAPRFDDTLGIYGQRDGYARFDAESLAGPVTVAVLPQLGARYEF